MLLTIAAFVVVLGVLIFVHEAGHFIAAKMVGIQVLRFSLGFGGPLVSFRWGETEYRIAVLPLGGYVKMAGLEEEGMAGELEGGRGAVPVDPERAFDRRPLWARIIVILAGVTMNAVFAFLIFSGIATTVGVDRTATTAVDTVLAARLPPGAEALATLRRGDRVTAVNGDSVATWEDLEDRLRLATPPVRVSVAGRAGPLVLQIGLDTASRFGTVDALVMYVPAEIGAVVATDPAGRAGLRAGDRVLRVDGDTVPSWAVLTRRIRAAAGVPLRLDVSRGGAPLSLVVTPKRSLVVDPDSGREVEEGYIGVAGNFPTSHTRYDLIGGLREGARQTTEMTGLVVRFLGLLVSGRVSPRELGGPIAIGQESGAVARVGLVAYFAFMAFLSLNLAVLNLLPIPILDGGQLFFLIAEGVRRKPLSLDLRLKLTQVGFVVLVGLMGFAIINDLLRVFGH